MVSTSPPGASLETRAPEPAVDLASLIEFLAPAVGARPNERAPFNWPMLSWSAEERVLGINTLAPLWRFRNDERARKVLGQHFIANAPIPKSAARAHLGGRITPDSEGRLRTAMERLTRAIDAEIDAAGAAGFDPSGLAAADASALLNQLASQLGIAPGDRLQGPTRIAHMRLSPVGATQQSRQEDVARYLAAIEEVEGTREVHIARFVEALRARLDQEDYPERTVQGALTHHSHQAATTGTQLSRFFDFLGDEALARVRLQVASRMMDTLADAAEERQQAHPERGLPLLTAYTRRATGLLEALATQGLPVNLSAVYGKAGDLDLRSHATTAAFVTCLPVWPQWMTQMFEERHDASVRNPLGDVTRELTYRFRVNGPVPDMPGMSAFENRLRRMEEYWLRLGPTGQEEAPQRVARSLAELVFLWAVIPASPSMPASGEDALQAAEQLVLRLEHNGRPALVQALQELRQRVPTVDEITKTLIGLMRTKGTVLTRSAIGRSWTYHINILREVVDLARAAEKVDRPLRCSTSPSQEQIDFLENIRVTSDQSFSRALFSIQVNVRLSEYSLQLAGEHETLTLARRQPKHLAQVVWRPYSAKLKEQTATWTPALASDQPWLAPGRVEIQYSPNNLRWPPTVATTPEGLQLLAATRVALAVLVYVTLLRLFQRAAPDGGRLLVSMLRLQQDGAESDVYSGEESLYAAAQAIEMLLGRDADLRMQGVVLDGGPNEKYKRKGAYTALSAGFPLVFAQREGERPVIGVISFAARPANDHPEQLDLPGNRLVLARTYVAGPTEEPFRGYAVRCASTQTEIIENPDLPLPPAVEREIGRLHAQEKCQHIILLEHRFGQRRAGNEAARSRLRRQDALLTYLTSQYPQVTIYPLVRDTFSATRLRVREIATEDAFEIVRPGEHFDVLTEKSRQLRHAYTPVYSLATLHVVGGADARAEKPQSGFCTYFLLRDDLAPVEPVEQMRANLILPTSPVRQGLIGVLRSIHYLEAERAIGPSSVQPVLDPYDWMAPLNVGKVGEVIVHARSRSAHGTVSLSITAVLDIVSRVVHALPRSGAARHGGR